MQVTVYYRDNTSEVFTGVTDYTVSGDVVTIVGTDAGGFTGTFTLHWSDIRRITTSGG